MTREIKLKESIRIIKPLGLTRPSFKDKLPIVDSIHQKR